MLAVQVPFEMVQRSVYVVPATPVNVEAGLLAVAIVPPAPLTMVQRPVPETGALAASVVDVPHTVWSVPAAAVEGAVKLVSTTKSELKHGPLIILQRRVMLKPAVSPVTVELFAVGVVITAPLEDPIIAQVPVPATGTLPARVKLPSLHLLWSGPALAGVTPVGSNPICTVLELGVQVPLEIVHFKVYVTPGEPLKPLLLLEGVTITPKPSVLPPAAKLHNPVPTTGALPASVAVPHTLAWFEPAVAVVGRSKTVIVTSSVEAVQVPLAIVQRKVTAPLTNPVTPEVGEFAEVIVAVPDTTVQVPVPDAGVLPASVAVETLHKF